MQHRRQTRCPQTQKVRFRDQDKAEKTLHRIRETSQIRSKTPVRAYYCTECVGWHLTAMPARSGRAEGER